MSAVRERINEYLKAKLPIYNGCKMLEECIQNIGKIELKKIARQLDISHFSQKKISVTKKEIKDKLNKEYIYEALLKIDNNQMKIIKDLYDEKNIYDEGNLLIESLLIQELGILYMFLTNNKKVIYVLPEEVKGVLFEIHNDFEKAKVFVKKRSRYSLIKRYMYSFLNLYGMIEKKHFVQIFNKQNKVKISNDEYIENLQSIINQRKNLYCIDNKIVQREIYVEYKEIEKKLSKLKYYETSKDEYMKYANKKYVEMTNDHYEFINYMSNNICDEEDAKNHVIHICCQLKKNNDIDEALIFLEEIDITHENYKEIITYIRKISLNMRKWRNKGNTVNEIENLSKYPKTEFENFTNVC